MPGTTLARRAVLAAALVCAGATTSRTAAAQPFTSLTFFGDSFTDTGNGDILAALFGAPDQTPTPPFAPGRASNGLVWADYFAAALHQPLGAVPSLAGGNNYAIGTARTGVTGTLGLPIGLLSQVSFFNGVSPIMGIPAAPHAGDPTGLYVLFAGSNDVFDAALGSPLSYGAALNAAVTNIGAAVTSLYAAGARNFLIPTIPNVGLAPLALGTPASPVLGALSAQFNVLLAGKLASLRGALGGSAFYSPRLDLLFDAILFDAAHGGTQYGLTNTMIPCLPGFAPPGVPQPPCEVSVFADGEHPTTAAHALIAGAALQAVPEPATVALVGGGLALLGVAVRRRRAA